MKKCKDKQKPRKIFIFEVLNWLRGTDLNRRPSGYEPDELPGCSTPRYIKNQLLLTNKKYNKIIKNKINIHYILILFINIVFIKFAF